MLTVLLIKKSYDGIIHWTNNIKGERLNNIINILSLFKNWNNYNIRQVNVKRLED